MWGLGKKEKNRSSCLLSQKEEEEKTRSHSAKSGPPPPTPTDAFNTTPRPLLFSFLCSHRVDRREVDADDGRRATAALKAALTQTGLSPAFLDGALLGPRPARTRRCWHWDLYIQPGAAAVLDPVHGHCWSATVDGRRYWGHEEQY